MKQSQAEDDFISELLEQQQEIHKRAGRVIDKKNQMIEQQDRLIIWLIKQVKIEREAKS